MSEVGVLFAPESTEEQSPQGSLRVSRRAEMRRRTTRFAAAGGIVLAMIALAAPAWAGPMSGC